jgi:serine protease Do
VRRRGARARRPPNSHDQEEGGAERGEPHGRVRLIQRRGVVAHGRPRYHPGVTSTTLLRGALAALFCTIGFSAAFAGAAGSAPALPSLPGPNGQAPSAYPPGPPPTAAAGPAGDAGSLADHTKRGVVNVERDGKGLAVGTVLANDGRVLTALSALGTSDLADIRYSDGHVVRSRVGHRDTAWDLALLVPLSGRWVEGLMASEADPAGLELRVMSPRAPKGALTATLKGRTDVHSKSGDAISAALDLDVKGGAPVGAPVVDAAGSVVGVVVHACRATETSTCVLTTVGAPVAALRNFLVRTPLNAVAPSPWLGIVGQPDTSGNVRGVRVMDVAPQSPAEKGGLKKNHDRAAADLIAAVDGQPVDTPESLADLIGKHAVGDSVKLLVFGGDKFRELTVVLRAAP